MEVYIDQAKKFLHMRQYNSFIITGNCNMKYNYMYLCLV